MQARVHGYERKDKQAQNIMFKGDQTKDHCLPCEGFFPFLSFYHFSIFFQPISYVCWVYSFACLFFFFFTLFLAHPYFQQGKLNLFVFVFGTQFTMHVFPLSLGQNLIIHVLCSNSSQYFPPIMEGDPWSRFGKEISSSKGVAIR